MQFQGFQYIVSPWLVALAAVVLVALAWLGYRNRKHIPPIPRSFLFFLRASAFLLILFLLLNPYFYSSRQVDVKPEIAVFLDNSESTAITKGEYEGEETYRQTLQQLAFENRDEALIRYYSIGSESVPFHPDSLSLQDSQTNLSDPVASILEMEENVQAAVLITDGIITYGRNPTVNAFNSPIPIYTIGLGDTTAVKDISISNVVTNQTGYIQTNHVVEADISQSGFSETILPIQIRSGDEVVEERSIEFSDGEQTRTLRFELELTEEGLTPFEIEVQPQTGEWSEANNTQAFSVDVLDSRVRILHMAFGIHPDVKTLRRVINTDTNNELHTLTWLGENAGFIEDIPENLDEFNLLVVQGNPPQSILNRFQQYFQNKPTLYFGEDAVSSNGQLPVELRLIDSQNPGRPVRLIPASGASEHPIMELPDIDFSKTPTLYGSLNSTLLAPQATPLFNVQYQGTPTETPLAAILEQGNLRRAHISAKNWYRFAQSSDQELRNFTRQFMENIISWTASNPDDRLLHISPVRSSFAANSQIIINATLLNESGQPEDDATIELQLLGNDIPRTFNLNNTGEGNYQLQLPALAEGLYEFNAVARKGNRTIDSAGGEFMVSNAGTELSNTTRNDELLQAIANNSGGTYFKYDEAGKLWDILSGKNMLQAQSKTVENYAFPVRSLYWFVIVLLLLGTEWILRKYYSLP